MRTRKARAPRRHRAETSSSRPARRGSGGAAAVYFVWGTTYLRSASRTRRSRPWCVPRSGSSSPAASCSWRSPAAAAGAARRAPRVGGAAVVGVAAAVRRQRLVATAERRCPTGIVALIIALVPLWLALIDRVVLRSAPLGWRAWSASPAGSWAPRCWWGPARGHVVRSGMLVASARPSRGRGLALAAGAPLPDAPLVARDAAGGRRASSVVAAVSPASSADPTVSKISASRGSRLVYLIVIGSLVRFRRTSGCCATRGPRSCPPTRT